MAAGLPYDSDAGRDYAACVTAIMCGEAYLQSSRIAELCPPLVPATEPTQKGLAETNLGANVMPGGACPGWYINREPFLDVIRMHRASRQQHQQNQRPHAHSTKSSKALLGRSPGPRRKARLPQLPGHSPRSHRHHRLHDGLRHYRHRARSGSGEVQEAGRRRHDQDRQQHRAHRALQARLQPRRRPTRSSATSTPPAPSKARPISRTSISRSSIAPSSRPRARARSTTWGI